MGEPIELRVMRLERNTIGGGFYVSMFCICFLLATWWFEYCFRDSIREYIREAAGMPWCEAE